MTIFSYPAHERGAADYGWLKPYNPIHRVFAPADLKPLVAECFRSIDNYLYQRVRFVGDRDNRGDVGTRARLLSRDASRQLARLESRVAALQPGPK